MYGLFINKKFFFSCSSENGYGANIRTTPSMMRPISGTYLPGPPKSMVKRRKSGQLTHLEVSDDKF